MSIEKEKQGLDLKEYNSTFPDKTYALRIGKEVPEGSVNLAYVHTPNVKAEENISLIDTTYTSDNVIPQDHMQSMAMANEAGELEYVDLISDDEVSPKPPGDTFPSNRISVTRRFKKNELGVDNALYYKFEIKYHYDSRVAKADEKGNYPVERYDGQQIELTDENGNLLDDTYKYDIYVQAHKENPRIYSVRIDLQKNNTYEETIMVRYNHIDEIVKNEKIQSVRKSVELYTNKNNQFTSPNQTKQMLESGKLRIVNAGSSFDESTSEDILKARENEEDKEVFAVVPKEDGSGYKIIVPQRSGSDPRVPSIFTHRIVATYQDGDKEIKRSVGNITDWCINPEALLKTEEEDYTGEWKNIGMPSGVSKLTAKEMLSLSIPFGMYSVPSNATFHIEDDKGNLLYSDIELEDNTDVTTNVNEVMSFTAEAKYMKEKESPWLSAMQDNNIMKNKPIPHRCSIIPEWQPMGWDFQWQLDGGGTIDVVNNYTSFSTPMMRIMSRGQSASIHDDTVFDYGSGNLTATKRYGSASDQWTVGHNEVIGKHAVELKADNLDFDSIIFGYTYNALGEFSFKTIIKDDIDDDIIGVTIHNRLENNQRGYFFAWEKDKRTMTPQTYQSDRGEGIVGTKHECDRIILSEYGLDKIVYDPSTLSEKWNKTKDAQKYQNEMGFGTQHKRIFRLSPQEKPAHESGEWNGATRYPGDISNVAFHDMGDMAKVYNHKGWEANKEYKITVLYAHEVIKVFINEDANSEERGELVIEMKDDSDENMTTGYLGIVSLSQRWAYFYDSFLKTKRIDTISGEKIPFTLTDTGKKRISPFTAEEIFSNEIANLDTSKDQEVLTIYFSSGGAGHKTTIEDDGYVYAEVLDPRSITIKQVGWGTRSENMTISGTGHTTYNADGTFTTVMDPSSIPDDYIPSSVKNFKWENPNQISGNSTGEEYRTMKIQIDENNILSAEPYIQKPLFDYIGRVYTVDEDDILKSEGIKSLLTVIGENSIYEELSIPQSVALENVCLRIERGVVTALHEDGTVDVNNPEHRVNYRFRCTREGDMRMPVDQYQESLGVNRIRLKDILNSVGEIDPKVTVELVAWTPFEDLSVSPLYAIKVEEDRKISIAKPKVENSSEELQNWYLRIKQGTFTRRLTLPYFDIGSPEKTPEIYVSYPQLLGMVSAPDEVVEVDLEYSIPEYTNQEFHNRPYTLIDKESPIILNEYAIQTRYYPLVLQSETGISYLKVFSIRGGQLREIRVSDVDAAKGVIYLIDRIREQDDVFVRYAYVEDWFTYRGFYKEKDFFHLDLNPTPGHFHTVAKNGFHRWIPINTDKETYTIDAKNTSNKELLVKQIHIYIRPTAIRKVVDQEVSVTEAGTIIPGTALKSSIFHTDEEWWFNPKDYKYDPTMLRLGKVTLQANSFIQDNMTILDTRTRGGGLDESLSKEIIRRINKESMYHWDIGYFDGEAYQENGIMIVRVPRSILKSDNNPNGFHESEVQEDISTQ